MKKFFRANSFVLVWCMLINLIIISNGFIVSSETASVKISSITIEDVYFPPGEHKLAAFNAKASADEAAGEASGSIDCNIITAAYNEDILTNAVIIANQTIEYNRRTEMSGNDNVLIADGNNYITVNMDFSENADSYRIFLFDKLDGLTPAAAIDKTPIPEIKTITEKATPVVYMAGDSTVCNYADNQFPRTGWGQVLGSYFTDGSVIINNQAKSGASSRSFRTQASYSRSYKNIINNIDTGDYLLIQFGHNDMWSNQPANDKYVRRDEFAHELFEYYVNMARDKGAYPVLVSSMVRYLWSGDTLNNNNAPYAATMKEFADAYGIPFIDLNAYSAQYVQDIGKIWSQDLYMKLAAGDLRFAGDSRFAASSYYNGVDDFVHFNYYGAHIWAKYIAEAIQSSDLYISKDIDLSYSYENPGDKFRNGSSVIAINGDESFEGDSPKFTKTASDGGAVEVVANPDTFGINTSEKVLKITPDTSMTQPTTHIAIISPVTIDIALPDRYLDMSQYSKYTLEFDMYLEPTEDSSRAWETTTGDKANHYAINFRNSSGLPGAAFVLASSQKGIIDTPDFRFGPRTDSNTAAPDYKITGASKGEWHTIKVEYLPDTDSFANTEIKMYLDNDYYGSSANYYGGSPNNPNTGMTQLYISGFMRNTIVLYVDNVKISAE